MNFYLTFDLQPQETSARVEALPKVSSPIFSLIADADPSEDKTTS